jgi:hypothetical protein
MTATRTEAISRQNSYNNQQLLNNRTQEEIISENKMRMLKNKLNKSSKAKREQINFAQTLPSKTTPQSRFSQSLLQTPCGASRTGSKFLSKHKPSVAVPSEKSHNGHETTNG